MSRLGRLLGTPRAEPAATLGICIQDGIWGLAPGREAMKRTGDEMAGTSPRIPVCLDSRTPGRDLGIPKRARVPEFRG